MNAILEHIKQESKNTVCLGDGAHRIWDNARQNFPDAVLILDFYYGSEHLGVLATALHGPVPANQVQQSQWCSAMKATSSAPIISATQSIREAGRHRMTPERIETIEREVAYLTSNLTCR